MRNIKGFAWNHKRVYRIYRELELNLRIKPRRRIKRDKPDQLSVPTSINQVWSMDFMSDNVLVERLWRSIKYEEVYLQSYQTMREAKEGIGAWIQYYNQERKHQILGMVPDMMYDPYRGLKLAA